MSYRLFLRLLACFLFISPCGQLFSEEENFLLINGLTDEIVFELGPHIEECVTPCSTFKIALSLMGFDSEILKDKMTPIWDFQEGYDTYLESWKSPQTPQSWMKTSCLWYSKVLAEKLGLDKMQSYLSLFEYGNQDMSGGLTTAWVTSSLKISPKGQVAFIQKMVQGKLPISKSALEMTKAILLVDESPDGWKLFGKTGWSGAIKDSDGEIYEIGWFVGWVEKEDTFFPFAYNIQARKINLSQRIPRVKQLLVESSIL